MFSVRTVFTVCVLSGCAPAQEVVEPVSAPVAPDEEETEDDVDLLAEDDRQRVQLCMYGAFVETDGGNPALTRICNQLPERVRAPNGRAGFLITEEDQAREALFDVLDSNGDGIVDDDDDTVVDVVGYSWGGVLTSRFDLHLDDRVQSERPLFGRVVLIDPFIPPAGEALDVSIVSQRLWSYVHSEVPAQDCSNGVAFGPYVGRPLDCEGSAMDCLEFDVSTVSQVGHCSIVPVVEDWVLANLLDGTDPAVQ